MKSKLMRLMETINVAVVKTCFAQKEDCDNIVKLRTAEQTETSNQQNLNLPTNQRTL